MSERYDLTPAALYARVSSDRQDVDLSVAGQLRALRDYAEKNGYVVAASTSTRPRAAASPTGPSSAGCWTRPACPTPLSRKSHPSDTIATENSGTRGRSD